MTQDMFLKLKSKLEKCEACAYGKQAQRPAHFFDEKPRMKPCEFLEGDITRLPILSRGKFRYVLFIIDRETKYAWLFLLRDRANLHLYVEKCITHIAKQYHVNVKRIRFDNEFDTHEIQNLDLCDARSSRNQDRVVSSIPHYLGVAERHP